MSTVHFENIGRDELTWDQPMRQDDDQHIIKAIKQQTKLVSDLNLIWNDKGDVATVVIAPSGRPFGTVEVY